MPCACAHVHLMCACSSPAAMFASGKAPAPRLLADRCLLQRKAASKLPGLCFPCAPQVALCVATHAASPPCRAALLGSAPSATQTPTAQARGAAKASVWPTAAATLETTAAQFKTATSLSAPTASPATTAPALAPASVTTTQVCGYYEWHAGLLRRTLTAGKSSRTCSLQAVHQPGPASSDWQMESSVAARPTSAAGQPTHATTAPGMAHSTPAVTVAVSAPPCRLAQLVVPAPLDAALPCRCSQTSL